MIPVLNPSGRTRADKDDEQGTRDIYLNEQKCTDRRKNANNVDLNRNFDIKWEQIVPTSFPLQNRRQRTPRHASDRS